ncbi:hypothetical protein [Stutzerimonas stutzeri]|uniref:hypothetical protein n=1 Tax=Stutzerimonas stutzeri TaxID=316 RepID=UPI00031B18DA|nr:hypothetical protein [Stutzerimonas stutzeri]
MTNTNMNTTENINAAQLIDQIIGQIAEKQGPVVMRCEKEIGAVELFIGIAAVQPKGEERVDLMPMLLSELMEQIGAEALVESLVGTRH